MFIPVIIRKKTTPIPITATFMLSGTTGSSSGAIDSVVGKAFHWGANSSIQRGNNKPESYIENPVPTPYSGNLLVNRHFQFLDGAVALQASNGHAWAWGNNPNGELGDGTNISKSSPISVLGGRSYREISGGQSYIIALEGSTGNAYAWGYNNGGMLGDNTTIYRSSPVSVLGGRSYSRVSGGGSVSRALEGSTGFAWVWGAGTGGELGNNARISSSSPVSVSGGRSYSRISGGGATNTTAFTNAIEASTGNAYAWGTNSNGQVGDNTTSARSSPTSVVGGRSFVELASGASYALAIEGSTGNAYAWGLGTSGTLGDNTIISRSSPTSVVGGRSFNQIAAGSSHSLAYENSTGLIWAWGLNSTGQLGNGISGTPGSPVSTTFTASASKLSITTSEIAYIEMATGRAYAYGVNANGELGDNTITNKSSPVSVLGGRSFNQIGSGSNSFVAIEGSTGNAYAWGLGTSGTLGDNTTVSKSSPVSVLGGRSYSIITGGGIGGSQNFALAIEGSTGNAWAWGSGGSGQLGAGTAFSRSSPISVLGARSYREISGGNASVVAIEASTGNVYTWGAGTFGQIGDGLASNRSSPISVLGGRSYSRVSGGGGNIVAIEGSTGNAYAWGAGTAGQLGDNTAINKSSPVSVLGGRSYREIVGGNLHVLAIEGSTGHAWAWGSNSNGVLGNGVTVNTSSPVSVLGSRSFNQIAARPSRSIAYEASTGIIWTWGNISNAGTMYGDGVNASPISVNRIFPF